MRIKQIYTLMITGVILLSFGITGCKKISSKSNEAGTELLAAESVTSPEEQTEIITEAVTEAPTVVIKPTEAPTEPVMVPTTEAVTEAPTVVIKPTEAPTEPVTMPPTQAPTEAPTVVIRPTETPTEPVTMPTTQAPTKAPAVVIKPTETSTEPVTVPTTQAPTKAPEVVIKPTEMPTEPVTVPPTQAPTEAPTEKSIWDYPFDVEAIRAQLIEWGEATGMKHITEVEGWGQITPENSSYNLPRSIDRTWCGEKAANRLKGWIEYSQTELQLTQGGNPLEYFTIWLEVMDNGEFIKIYLLG